MNERMRASVTAALLSVMLAPAASLAGSGARAPAQEAAELAARAPGEIIRYEVRDKDGKRLPDYVIPDDTAIDREPNAAQIRLGQRLLNDTRHLLPANTGASMNCNSCHIQQGKKPLGAPYINTFNTFPQYNPRADRIVTLEDRINGCFQRSMNGKPLARDGADMAAMVAYMKWLAQDVPHGAKVQIQNAYPIDTRLVPDATRGAALYAKHCAACHGENGAGKKDPAGQVTFPP